MLLRIGLFSTKKKLHWRQLGSGRCRIYVRIRIILTDSDPAPTFTLTWYELSYCSCWNLRIFPHADMGLKHLCTSTVYTSLAEFASFYARVILIMLSFLDLMKLALLGPTRNYKLANYSIQTFQPKCDLLKFLIWKQTSFARANKQGNVALGVDSMKTLKACTYKLVSTSPFFLKCCQIIFNPLKVIFTPKYKVILFTSSSRFNLAFKCDLKSC